NGAVHARWSDGRATTSVTRHCHYQRPRPSLMLAEVQQPERLLHISDAAALTDVQAALHPGWRSEAVSLLDDPRWRGQLVACHATVISGSDVDLDAALWRAIDGGSWVAPQLAVTSFLLDPEFEARAEQRLLSVTRRGPKVIAALVRV